jgi:hypothetical protein
VFINEGTYIREIIVFKKTMFDVIY